MAPPPPPCDVDAAAPACSSLGRFSLSMTPGIRSLLERVGSSPGTPPALVSLCKQYADEDAVPWKLVQQCCVALRRDADGPGDAQAAAAPAASTSSTSSTSSISSPQQHHEHRQQQAPAQLPPAPALCAGGRILLPSPPARQRSKQAQARLAQLQEAVDAQQYAAMVADVTRDERQAADALSDPFFPTTKLQLSFGLHVLATMGAFFALGFYGGRLVLGSDAWAALCGAVGLLAGLLLETVLLILRTNMPAPLESKYGHLLAKDWQQRQWQRGPGSADGKAVRQVPAAQLDEAAQQGAAAGSARGALRRSTGSSRRA